MNLGVSMLRILFLLDVGGAQVLATGKPPGAEIDFKYALIGTAVGIAVSASFLALKICMIRRHLFDDDSSDLKSTPGGLNGETTISSKDTCAVLPFHQSWYTKYGEVSPSVTACSSDVKALFSSPILIGLSTLFLVASAQIYASSPTTESDKFPKICLLTSRNDFSFCRQSR
ncbi:transmembrane protein 273 isoform X4 [Papio anubis]|uniref:transmembrane protein 273 isoform X4 n=1 Tax=Papio anubis TaxID=9555 RepID=UPI0004F1E357|nr:transmembrane protein 273 isoform X4 [Papio anubis]